MDFFQNQDSARRRTGLLIFYYILAVILIVVAVYAVFTFAFTNYLGVEEKAVEFWNRERILAVTAAVLLIVGGGTLFKTSQLKTGGSKVARLLGGREVDPNTKNHLERRLLNIVEEMSIASGVQVPRVYILDKEEGINAFAAGFSQDDAAVAVTGGCLETLSRDQLQGVIAHEFSHILNGDMRLNIKLMGILFGIMVITFLGYMFFRSSLFATRRRSSSRSGGGGGRLAMVLFALSLMIIGYIGVFFGNLIKSAVSRQREYLADASAVQFTRNPSGMAGALKKIAGYASGTKVENRHAQEASHLFFVNALSGAFAKLFSTHPPIRERIRRIDPSLAGEDKNKSTPPGSPAGSGKAAGFAGGSERAKLKVNPEDIVSAAGTTRRRQIDYASELMDNIPSALTGAAHEQVGGMAVIYALLFSSDKKIREKQISCIKEKAPAEVFSQTVNIYPQTRRMPVEYRIPLIDMAISALKNISAESYGSFKNNIHRLVEADGKISVFEYTVQKMILRHLQPAFTGPDPPRVRYRSLKSLLDECSVLLSMLARSGIDEESKKLTAFKQGESKLGIKKPLEFLEPGSCRLDALDRALDKLNQSAPKLKKKIIEACVSCIASDGLITHRQAELIRITADAIGCPLPPILPGKPRGF